MEKYRKVEKDGEMYMVITRDEFSYYILEELSDAVDPEKDSAVILTQFSDYIFEKVTKHHNGFTVDEMFLVSSSSFSKNRGGDWDGKE